MPAFLYAATSRYPVARQTVRTGKRRLFAQARNELILFIWRSQAKFELLVANMRFVLHR